MRSIVASGIALAALTASCGTSIAGKEMAKVDPRGPQSPAVSGLGYQEAMGKLATAGWSGPMTIEDTTTNTVRDTDACFDGGRRCWYRFQAPSGNNALQIERIIGVGPDRVERYRLIPDECGCATSSDDRAYPWMR